MKFIVEHFHQKNWKVVNVNVMQIIHIFHKKFKLMEMASAI
jgi:hypothetical protein